MLKIVLLEDNSDWQSFATEAIKKAIGEKVELVKLETEHEFVNRFSEFRSAPPALFIIDVMVPWAEPSPDIPKPPEPVVENGYFRAGKRCHELLATDEQLRRVPIIFWTIVSEADLKRDYTLESRWGDNVCYVPKDSPDLDKLARKIRKHLAGQQQA